MMAPKKPYYSHDDASHQHRWRQKFASSRIMLNSVEYLTWNDNINGNFMYMEINASFGSKYGYGYVYVDNEYFIGF